MNLSTIHNNIARRIAWFTEFSYNSLEPQIKQSVQELGSLLAKVKGQGQVSLNQPSQRNNIAQESDAIMEPLLNLLDEG